LKSIFADTFCREKGFTESNTLLVDSDSRKVQLWLANTLISEPYVKEDVCLLPSLAADAQREGTDALVRDSPWQEAYMAELTQQIL